MKSLLSSHGLVLLAVALSPGSTVEQIAERTDLAPRYVNIVLRDLKHRGLVLRDQEGRLTVNYEARFTHPLFRGRRVQAVLEFLCGYLGGQTADNMPSTGFEEILPRARVG
jgi:hypothetical protein